VTNARTSTDRSRATTLGVLFVVFALGMGLRLYQLDADSLWLDEIKTATASRVDLLSVPQSAARTSIHPPLLYIVTDVFFLLFGNSDFVVRLPAALLGSASILLTYKAGKMLWTEKEGLAGAFLLAVSPYHIEYSQEARHYALMVFLALTSLILLLKGLETGRKTLWLGFAASTSLALYTHYFAFLILPAEVAFAVWLTGETWWSSRRGAARTQDNDSLQADASSAAGWTGVTPTDNMQVNPARSTPSTGRLALGLLGSLLLIAFSYVPWLPVMWTQITRPNMAFQGFNADPAQIAGLSPQFFHNLLSDYSGVSGVPLLLFVALFILGLANSRRQTVGLTLLWIATPFLFLAFVRVEHWIHPRYAICVLPVYLLVVARGLGSASAALSSLVRRTMDSVAVSTAVMSPMVILVGLFSATSLDEYYHQQKEDWRGTAQYLASNIQTGDAILADGIMYHRGRDDDRVHECLPYYLDGYLTERGAGMSPIVGVESGVWTRLQNLEEWDGGLWGVLWHRGELLDSDTAHVARFHDIAVVTLNQASGRELRDTESMLRVFLDLIPAGDAHFDVHLALANLCIRTGQFKCASSELDLAAASVPDDPAAPASLSAERSRFEQLSGRLESMAHPLWHSLGDRVALLGYDLGPGALLPGETLRLTTWWRALGNMNEDYTVFVHLLDSDGGILAQEDKLLQRESRPTSVWGAREIVMQRHELALPADTRPGEYTISVGLYCWQTGERLPVWDAQGERLHEDVIVLQRLEVVHADD
jgi:mannosyltransferase